MYPFLTTLFLSLFFPISFPFFSSWFDAVCLILLYNIIQVAVNAVLSFDLNVLISFQSSLQIFYPFSSLLFSQFDVLICKISAL